MALLWRGEDTLTDARYVSTLSTHSGPISSRGGYIHYLKEEPMVITSTIYLKPISELLGESFYIPAYQRGYRWTEQQVVDLLEDVMAFQGGDENRSREGFYCLQPVVVKQRDSLTAWEVVDGQQRLTTLYLIIQYFNLRMVEEERYPLYSVDYETRIGTKAYLEDPQEETASENIDFHFIYLAYAAIKEWFKDKRSQIRDFEGALLNRVKVIWYELPVGDSAIDAFTRLNVGKIPLTNAELVRALFLRSKNFPQLTANLEQLRIAQDWDLMEKALQNDDFWYFLTETTDLPNRIEFIFDLITKAARRETKSIADDLRSFHHFNSLLSSDETNPDRLWIEVKSHFYTLDEWYRDQELFHLIGYQINEGDSVIELLKLSRAHSKSAFLRALKDRIAARLLGDKIPVGQGSEKLRSTIDEFLGNLEYGVHSNRIKSVLLLFNIASIIANKRSIVRFRFDYFKKEKWDIEHIRAVTEQRPTANIDKKPWLEVVCKYFEMIGGSANLREKAAEMLSAGTYTTDENFEALYVEILKHFEEDESTEVENGIGNLALLDSGTNRGYKNAVFPIKRDQILQRDRAGTFVPLCTRNAFLKAYSKKVDKMLFWGEDDQDSYRTAMAETLTDFFK